MTRWFQANARELPWRRDHDPYHVLVAEFILQQTRMEVGVPRFASFVARFPTIESLARANESDVLAEWSGLGYYARAKNLHRTAREIVDRFGSEVPQDPAVLRALPGIGPYTAGAIASIAFDRPEPSLDGNQFRVLGRFLGVDAATNPGRTRADQWARGLLAQASPRILNQALMDLGGRVCTPVRPDCGACPLFAGCRTRGPRRGERRAVVRARTQEWTATRFVRGGRVWLVAPRGEGLLGTHWLPPLTETKSKGPPDLEHAFSHRRWRIWWGEGAGSPAGNGRWVARSDLSGLPHGPLTRKFVEWALVASDDGSSRSRHVRRVGRAAPGAGLV